MLDSTDLFRTKTYSTPALLSMNDLQERLGVKKTMVKKIIAEGINGRPPLPVIRLGRAVRVREDKLMNWLEMTSA